MINVYKNYTFDSVQKNLSSNTKNDDVNNYFNSLKLKHPNVSLTMCSGFNNINGKVNLCISPQYLKKAMHDPKAAEYIEHEINNIPDATSFIWAHSVFPNGAKVKSVSYSINANGEPDMHVDVEQPKNTKSGNTDKSSDKLAKKLKERLKERKLKSGISNLNNPYLSNYYANTSDMLGLSYLDKNI